MNFYRQKKLLDTKNIRRNYGIKNTDGEFNAVFMQESLTKYTSDLLKEAKLAAGALSYKYPGYTINGEVRVKILEGAKYIAIKSVKDLQKIK